MVSDGSHKLCGCDARAMQDVRSRWPFRVVVEQLGTWLGEGIDRAHDDFIDNTHLCPSPQLATDPVFALDRPHHPAM